MSNTNQAGLQTDRVCTDGGSVRVTISGGAGRGNGGTSLPCKKCWLISSANTTRWRIGSACTATTGQPVPCFIPGSVYMPSQEVNIDDIAKIYFYGTGSETIDIGYIR